MIGRAPPLGPRTGLKAAFGNHPEMSVCRLCDVTGPRHATAWLGLAWCVFRGCTTATALSNADEPLHTVVTDPVGDVEPDSRITILPDLTSATVDVADRNYL